MDAGLDTGSGRCSSVTSWGDRQVPPCGRSDDKQVLCRRDGQASETLWYVLCHWVLCGSMSLQRAVSQSLAARSAHLVAARMPYQAEDQHWNAMRNRAPRWCCRRHQTPTLLFTPVGRAVRAGYCRMQSVVLKLGNQCVGYAFRIQYCDSRVLPFLPRHSHRVRQAAQMFLAHPAVSCEIVVDESACPAWPNVSLTRTDRTDHAWTVAWPSA